MTRLQSELDRLYVIRSPSLGDNDAPASPLIDPGGSVRVMVMELTRPPNWELLSQVWRGVQTELELPAPAIAVSGTDGLQLWFSLEAPIGAAHAHAILEALRARFLPDVEAKRVRLLPAAQGSSPHQPQHAQLVPALQQSGNWSAFVAADLAPIFEDTPWLDIPPNDDGQAALLRGLQVIKKAALDEAIKRLGPGVAAALTQPPLPRSTPTVDDDPRRFLLRVMNDDSVALALRIEAAKALLPVANAPINPAA